MNDESPMTPDQFVEWIRKLAEFGKVTHAATSPLGGHTVQYEHTLPPVDTSMADAMRELGPKFIQAFSPRNGLRPV